MQWLITFGLALYSFFLIELNMSRLPARIPMHFNTAGEADGWGGRGTLWVLLLAQVSISVLFLLIPILARRFPGTVNIGSRNLSDFTPEQRDRVVPLFSAMMGNMSVLISLLLSVLMLETIRAASSRHPHITGWWELGLFLAGIAVNIIYYSRRMLGVANESRSEKPA